MGRVTRRNNQPPTDMAEELKHPQSYSSAPSGRVHPLVQPSDLISVLTDEPLLTEEDIALAMKHNASWRRELVLIVRKRASERMATIINEMASCAEAMADDGLNAECTNPEGCQ